MTLSKMHQYFTAPWLFPKLIYININSHKTSHSYCINYVSKYKFNYLKRRRTGINIHYKCFYL